MASAEMETLIHSRQHETRGSTSAAIGNKRVKIPEMNMPPPNTHLAPSLDASQPAGTCDR
jgi:hypothetical protein